MAESALALREHPQIIELLSVLEQNSLSKQKEEVQALVGYIDGMEEKLSQMMEMCIRDRALPAPAGRRNRNGKGGFEKWNDRTRLSSPWTATSTGL